MKSFLNKQDLCALSDFEANIEAFINKVSETKQPLVLTENGTKKAVLLDINNYEKLIEELELLKDIRIAEEQLQNGDFISNEEARKLFDKE